MPCPFPGMDPYLEAPRLWPGLHQSLILYARDQLQPGILPRYYIEVGERIYFEERHNAIYPDLTLIRQFPPVAGRGTATLVEPDAPILVEMSTRQREIYLEIRLTGSDEVVTVLEVLSPANKRVGSEGRREYCDKQARVLASPVHLVEIDLLRAGEPVICATPGKLLVLEQFDYVGAVSRASDRESVELYPVTMRQRLPRMRIPLRDPDPDIVLDLPAVFATAYDNGAYAVRVDYREDPVPPFRRSDEAWADALLREAGFRS